MHNYSHLEAFVKDRHAQAITTAENHRRAQLSQTDQPSVIGGIAAGVGDILVGVGTHLQKQRPTVNTVMRTQNP
jgi:hypothetical protein